MLRLLRKEWMQLWRSQSTMPSLVLYVFTTTFIVYAAYINITPQAWMALYWIIIILSVSNAAQQSFQELRGLQSWYYYSLSSPEVYFYTKVISLFLLTMILSFLIMASLTLFAGIAVQYFGLFLWTNVIVWIGFAFIFSFLSFLVIKLERRSSFLTLLAFPLLLPLLLLAVKLSTRSTGLVVDSSFYNDILLMVGVDLLIIGLSITLIPYLWRS